MATPVNLSDLLDRWEDAFSRGELLAPEDLCADCPEHAAAVRQAIQSLLASRPRPRAATDRNESAERPRIAELLGRWEAGFDRGRPPSVDELCRDCPELRADVEREIDALQALGGRLTSAPRQMVSSMVGGRTGVPHETFIPNHPGDVTESQIRRSLVFGIEYEDLRYHDGGGLGMVYKGTDSELRRDVAVKFIRPQHTHSPLIRERFLYERAVTSRLDHPGVVPVYAVGETEDGLPFYAMRFVDGDTLERAIEEHHHPPADRRDARPRALGFGELLQRFIAACNTIAYAHNCGIVHLDIKPGNIMLGRFGETLVVDWGLARQVGRPAESLEETIIVEAGNGSGGSSGSGGGTPTYMSPEQAASSPNLGTPSDVYSLGATLYKILTGKNAVVGRSQQEVIDKAQRGDFPPPRAVEKSVSRALEAVCLKAMARNPADRYRSALDLAADVQRWLADEPASAYKDPPTRRLARWARRHRGWSQGILIGLVALVMLAVGAAVLTTKSAHRERALRTLAEDSRKESLRATALFAAKTVANEIDLRWRILEAEANDGTLQDLLVQAGQTPQDPAVQEELQDWLLHVFMEHQKSTQYDNWFINAADGTQMARVPAGEMIGENFAYRTYFHGGPRDMPEDDRDFDPIRDVNHSHVYRSRTDGRLRISFSVPIWGGERGAADRRVLGVLSMSVDLGEFRSLGNGLGEGKFAVLVDTRKDWLDKADADPTYERGLILHHPGLDQLSPPGEEIALTARLDEKTVGRMIALRGARMSQKRSGGPHTKTADNLLWNYRDPLESDPDATWMAAFEPVLVNGRPESICDTGWIVVVQERQVQARSASE